MLSTSWNFDKLFVIKQGAWCQHLLTYRKVRKNYNPPLANIMLFLNRDTYFEPIVLNGRTSRSNWSWKCSILSEGTIYYLHLLYQACRLSWNLRKESITFILYLRHPNLLFISMFAPPPTHQVFNMPHRVLVHCQKWQLFT